MEVDEPTPTEGPEPPRGALRPRERLREQGVGALSDAELLALVLGSGVPGRSATRVGRQLARRHPSELASWPLARWLAVAGVGPARASALVAAFELGRRALDRPTCRAPIRGPEDVLPHVRDLPRARREHFVVLLLNARHELERRETVSIGSLNAVQALNTAVAGTAQRGSLRCLRVV